MGDSHRLPVQVKPQFAELAVQLPRVGLAQERSFISQEVDVECRLRELISRQLLKPVPYFRLQLNRTPSHSVDAINRETRKLAGATGEPWNRRLADQLDTCMRRNGSAGSGSAAQSVWMDAVGSAAPKPASSSISLSLLEPDSRRRHRNVGFPLDMSLAGCNSRYVHEDFDRYYRAVQSKDPRFDGWFVTAVLTTKIYCRPSCPARSPFARNVRFYPTAAAAQRAGFRACKRCRPDASPGSPEWNTRGDVVARAMRLIADGEVDRIGVTGLAARLGYTPRQLERLLQAEVGAGPLALARAQRAQTARILIETTELPFGDVAFAAGFASIRQFNDTVREVFETTPTDLRTRATGPLGSGHPSRDGSTVVTPAAANAIRVRGCVRSLGGHRGTRLRRGT